MLDAELEEMMKQDKSIKKIKNDDSIDRIYLYLKLK